MRRGRLPWILAASVSVCAVMASSCGGPEKSELMPLTVGKQMTYSVNAGFEKMIDPIKVARTVPVAGTTGYELTSSFGTSRLAWRDGELLAAQTANAFFTPPIPLLTEDGSNRDWTGKIESMGRVSQGTATLTQKKSEKIRIATQEFTTQATELTFRLPRGTIVVNSWFASGIGLVQQEQRTNDQFVLRLELLNRS